MRMAACGRPPTPPAPTTTIRKLRRQSPPVSQFRVLGLPNPDRVESIRPQNPALSRNTARGSARAPLSESRERAPDSGGGAGHGRDRGGSGDRGIPDPGPVRTCLPRSPRPPEPRFPPAPRAPASASATYLHAASSDENPTWVSACHDPPTWRYCWAPRIRFVGELRADATLPPPRVRHGASIGAGETPIGRIGDFGLRANNSTDRRSVNRRKSARSPHLRTRERREGARARRPAATRAGSPHSDRGPGRDLDRPPWRAPRAAAPRARCPSGPPTGGRRSWTSWPRRRGCPPPRSDPAARGRRMWVPGARPRVQVA